MGPSRTPQFKHNRKRNVGLVYEFLVRRVSAQVLAGDAGGVRRALGITRKYFSAGQPLARERELFDAVRGTRGASADLARRVLSEVRGHARRLDPRVLEIKKSNLIKDVNYAFGRDFYKEHRVPEYRLFASIEMFLAGARSPGRLSEGVELLGLEEALVRYMTSREPAARVFKAEERADALSLALAEQKFQRKYGSALSAGQRRLLGAYVRSLSSPDGSAARLVIEAEAKKAAAALAGAPALREVRDDAVMAERLTEAREMLGRVPAMPAEQGFQELMLYQRLVEELGSGDDV